MIRSFIFTLVVVFSLASCASMKRSLPKSQAGDARIESSTVEAEDIVGPPELYGPQIPSESDSVAGEATNTQSGEIITEANPESTGIDSSTPAVPGDNKICLILGPGMARAIAMAPILDAIKKAQIPVHCVVGSEMGALVGALYSFYGGNSNSIQWQLFKLNKENYFNFPLLSLRDPKSSGKKLHDFIQEIFKGKKIEELPIRFAAVGSDEAGEEPVFFNKGDLAGALSASLALPGIFDPWSHADSSFQSGAITAPVAVEAARSLGGTFFVFVDVLGEDKSVKRGSRFHRAFGPVRNLIRLQRKEVDFVVQVRAQNIPFDEFSRQGDAFSVGQAAADAQISKLKEVWEKQVAQQE